MNIKIVKTDITRKYIVISDDLFIHIEELPYNYPQKKEEYNEYFKSLFDRERSVFISMYYNDITPQDRDSKNRYIVNFVSPNILARIETQLDFIINRRLYE